MGQSGVGSSGIEGVLHILQGWSFTIRLFNVIPRTLMGRGSYPSEEMQLVYSTASADWVYIFLGSGQFGLT